MRGSNHPITVCVCQVQKSCAFPVITIPVLQMVIQLLTKYVALFRVLFFI